MKFGICSFNTQYSIPATELGPAMEERGFESLWLAEHTHIPAARLSPWPGGSELPQMYYDTLDPFVSLTAAAVTTSTLRLGTGIALAIQRDPIQLAKEVASLDVVSNGRFSLGIGGGWNLEEMAHHGTDPSTRFRRLRETVEAMQALWTNEVAEYHGQLIDFAPSYQNPKPIQKPHPPIHVGGSFPGVIKRVVSYCDGWMPIWGRGTENFPAQLDALDEALTTAGRKRSDIEISIYLAPMDPSEMSKLQDLGVDRVIFGLPSVARDEALPILDSIQQLM
ncbi:MAG: LLM class F420-dependent oxidoreductase [Pseudomonadales bacterium]